MFVNRFPPGMLLRICQGHSGHFGGVGMGYASLGAGGITVKYRRRNSVPPKRRPQTAVAIMRLMILNLIPSRIVLPRSVHVVMTRLAVRDKRRERCGRYF